MTIDLRYGDTIEQMKLIPDKSIDFICCDLPYGTTACAWDIIIPFDKLWEQYKRIIKDKGVIVLFGSEPFSSLLRTSNLDWYKYDWIWEKSQPGTCMSAKNRPMKKHEDILIFSPGTTANCSGRRMNYYPQGLIPCKRKRSMGDNNSGKNGGSFKTDRPSRHPYIQEWTGYPNTVLHFDNERGVDHPTQKPVALFEYLIKTYTNEGDLVLDNCAGSGTTAIAALNCSRHYILIEKEPKYVEIARKRIAEVPTSLTKWGAK